MRSEMIGVEDLRSAMLPEGWLGHSTRDRFHPLAASAGAFFRDLGSAEAERFFARRSLRSPWPDCDERTLAQALVAVDLRAVAHATSFLHAENAEQGARELLQGAVGTALADDPAQLDHVGLEVFGRLEWYVAAVEAFAARAGLKLCGHRLFPSVQVRKALAYDSQLAGVRIARIYFELAGRPVNLEIFEATQHWLFTAARQLATHADVPAARFTRLFRGCAEAGRLPAVPVGHVALAVAHARTLEAVDRVLKDPQDPAAAAPTYAGLSYNPADESLNTKFRARGEAARRSGPLIELISYGVRAANRAGRGAAAPAATRAWSGGVESA